MAQERSLVSAPAKTARPVPGGSSVLGAWVRRGVFYLILFAVWEGVARLEIWPSYLLPGPIAVGESLLRLVANGTLWEATVVSMQRIGIGFGLSLLIGLPLGVLLGRSHLVSETFGSLVIGLQTLPSVCWLPLAILWLGLSEQAIIFVVTMGALFAVALGVEAGVKNTPPLYIQAARTLGARGLALATQVTLPAALPSILSGLKQGWAFAWRSLMMGELLFFTLSLGNLLQVGRDLSDTAQVMAIMIIIILLGLTVDLLIFAPLEHRVRRRWGLYGKT
jgi:NitT/TauT family transport system permease protein